MQSVNLGLLCLALALAQACGGSAEFSSSSVQTRRADLNPAAGGDQIDETPGRKPRNTSNGADPTGSPQTDRIEQSFKASEETQGEVRFNPTPDLIELPLTMQNAYTPMEKEFTQVDRPTVTKLAKQGTDGQTLSNTFAQANSGVLDIQLVIDNSASMSQEQSKLAPQLAPLLEYIAQADWRINVVTTDPANGCSRRLINKGDADGAAAFAAAVKAGTGGNGNEQGIRTAVDGLKCNLDENGTKKSWVRPNSTVAVLIVSDEDNCSDGKGCGTEPWNTENYLLNHLTAMGRKLGVDARVYGIYWKKPMLQGVAASEANQYHAAVLATGGTYGDISASDYKPTLTQISKDIAVILKTQFQLAQMPDANSLTIKVNKVEQTNGWSVAGSTLTFLDGYKPSAGAAIDISYTVGSIAKLSAIALGEVPAHDTVQVIKNGQVVAASAYTIDDNAKTLTFVSEPEPLADIKISFRAQRPRLTEVDLAAKARQGTITVLIDETATTAFTHDPAGKIVFNQPPADGARIVVKYAEDKGKVLTYSPAIASNAPKDLDVIDQATGASVQHTFDGGTLTFPASEHQEDRKLLVRFRNESASGTVLDLPAAPIATSLKVDTNGGTCGLGNGVTLDGAKLKIDCPFANAADMKVTFAYRSKPKREYALNMTGNTETGIWTVWINDVETKDYQRSGAKVTLNKVPAVDATVRIAYSHKVPEPTPPPASAPAALGGEG